MLRCLKLLALPHHTQTTLSAPTSLKMVWMRIQALTNSSGEPTSPVRLFPSISQQYRMKNSFPKAFMASAVLRMMASFAPLLIWVLTPQPQPTSGMRPCSMSQ